MFLAYYNGGTFVGKYEVSKWPFFGTIAIAFQTIFVKRQSKDSRGNVLSLIKERATSPGWPTVCIFPGLSLDIYKNRLDF